VTVWVWEATQSVTAMAMMQLAMQIPRVVSSVFAGVIVDRYSRKRLMLLSDAIAACSTVILILLYWSDHLALGPLYLIGAINSCFGQIQGLAYSSAIATLVPKAQYSRASSMGAFFHYGSNIIAPALAGSLYPLLGFAGILSLDLLTFTVGILTLAAFSIPQPPPSNNVSSHTFSAQLSFGFRYLRTTPSLLILLLTTSLFWLIHDLGGAIFTPLILARTDNNTQILGQIFSAAGLGGVLSATIISIWGGPKRKIQGLLSGMIGAGLCKTIFGLATTPWLWLPAQFSSSLNFPLMSSSNASLWLEKIPPDIQGRIFSVRLLMRQLAGAGAIALAGPLTDSIFIPAMSAQGHLTPWLSPLFGTGAGAGIAVLYVLTALGLLLVGIIGLFIPALQQVEHLTENRE
ncbi:MAG: MFS transporter, partial [Kamptonema sp. SIO4C4]|nr:MFS transporter [Kamptonema sp. SIO4C4]